VVSRERVDDETHYRLVGVPADGSELTVRFGEQVEPVGRLRLPLRAPIRVHVDAGVESGALEQALRADAAVEWVTAPADADLRIVADADTQTDRPTLRLLPAADGAYAFFLRHEDSEDSQRILMQALGEFGLDRIDANEWATEAGRAIAIGAEPGPHRELQMWAELLDENRFGFVESRSFPLMVGRAIRWLVDLDPIVPYLAAGDPVPQAIDGQGVAFATLSDWQPLQAGAFESAQGGAWSASVLTRQAGFLSAGASTSEPSKSELPSERGAALLTWVLALAAGLVLLEWALYSRGQIP
jgi:hypothetical protein